jgi:hypothetical protein
VRELLDTEVFELLSVTVTLIVYFVTAATLSVQLGVDVVVPEHPLAGRPLQVNVE